MNYPKGILKQGQPIINYKNRGMGLEKELNATNEYYRDHDLAIVHKKPTPITITKVDYPSRREAVIKEAYFKTPSTTDYNGVYQGKYLDFEAKETRNMTLFPLDNIHPHQLAHLKKVISHGGIGFLIVRFTRRLETYFLDGCDLFTFLEEFDRKSIPIAYFKEKGYFIKEKIKPQVDYLEIVKHIYFKGD